MTSRRTPPRTAPQRNDEGSALVEFVGVSVLLILPLVYLLLSVFSVQRTAFAVTQAAREAGRAYATAPSSSAAAARAQYAAELALDSQGVRSGLTLSYGAAHSGCSTSAPGGAPNLRPGAQFVVCVRSRAGLPLGGSIMVSGQYAVTVDTYRADRP